MSWSTRVGFRGFLHHSFNPQSGSIVNPEPMAPGYSDSKRLHAESKPLRRKPHCLDQCGSAILSSLDDLDSNFFAMQVRLRRSLLILQCDCPSCTSATNCHYHHHHHTTARPSSTTTWTPTLPTLLLLLVPPCV